MRHGLDQQRLARLEVVHQRALGDPGALGDPPCGQRGVAVLDEALRGRVDERQCACRGALLGPRRAPSRACGLWRGSSFVDHVIDDATVPFADQTDRRNST